VRRVPACLAALLLAVCSGCAGRSGLYDWGEYEDALQAQYVGHDQAAALEYYQTTFSELQRRNDARIPPGLFGDYGFLLFVRGDYAGARASFEREKQLFPESGALMDRLIAKVREREGQPAEGGIPAPTPPFSSSDSQPPGSDDVP
jgi:hypothetical protein